MNRESRGESLFARQRQAGINGDDVRLASYFAGFNLARKTTKRDEPEDASEREESYEGKDI